MHPTIRQLLDSGPVTTDGAWGTQMHHMGLQPGQCPDAWNLTNPDKVQQIAASYVEAGSQVILTNTFGANRFVLARHNAVDKLVAINRAGVEISRRAAGGRAAVFASVGPSGVMLMLGAVKPEQLHDAFLEQAQAIAGAMADGIVIETMSDLQEAVLAVKAAKQTGLPVVACMSFDSGPAKDRTMMGVTPEQAAQQLAAAGADCIGANCGQGIEGYVNICRRLRAATELPIWIKPNAGLPELVNGTTVYKQTPEQFAAHVPELLAAGASFVGGCCGTTPDFIKAIRVALNR